MMDREYNEFMQENKLIYQAAFIIALTKQQYDTVKLNQLYIYDTDIGDILEIQDVLLSYSEGIEKFDSIWVDQKTNEIENLKRKITSETKNMMQKINIISLTKAALEDLQYISGERSMPNIRNIKRINAIKMLENKESVDKIKEYLK